MKYRRLPALLLLILALLTQACKKEGPKPEEPVPEEPGNEQAVFPGKELRGVWMTTVWGLDWPMGTYSIAGQQQQYKAYLDKFVSLNINAVFVQVRGMGDSFYPSSYEPWSAAITGVRGADPGYDVLDFMIREAHARGIQFHAWLNPYRIATRTGATIPYPPLHPSIPSDWVIDHEKIQIYNPAIPEVRHRLVTIVRELISRYDVDGVHFDDYFYPDPAAAGTMVSDQTDYEKYGVGHSRIEDFRRDNVNKAIESVFQEILQTKPEVAFSVSPTPNNTYNYGTLFADVVKWDREGWVDILIPQLYQEIGNPYNDFQQNLNWWSANVNKAALMVGYGYYKFGDPSMPAAFQSVTELQRQFDLVRKKQEAQGHVLFSARFIMENKIQVTAKLAELFKNPAVMPPSRRTTSSPPTSPSGLQLQGSTLKWTGPTAHRYVVYHFPDFSEAGKVVAILESNQMAISSPGYYCVTALSRDNQESTPTDFIEKK